MPLKLKAIGKTDKGLVRKGNEDCLHLDDKNKVYAVCDGMGGHQAGEVASMMASEILDIIYAQFVKDIRKDDRLEIKKKLTPNGNILLKAIRLANRSVYNKALTNSALHGMGTTIVSMTFEDDIASIAHVGDSRAYRIDADKLIPLTTDHSWVAEIQKAQNLTEEEASSVVGKNVITRALGVRDNVEIDYSQVRIKQGQKFLLCSDGLCGYADDDEIFDAIRDITDNNEKMVDNLIQMANDRGGADNVTVIVIEVLEITESNNSAIKPFTLPAESNTLLEHEDEWLEKVDEYIANKNSKPSKKKTENPTKALIFLFSLFIIAAVIIIYLSLSK